MSFFSWLQSLCISTALFDTPIRTRYFTLLGPRSGLPFVSHRYKQMLIRTSLPVRAARRQVIHPDQGWCASGGMPKALF
jgi:hypothetical protein